MVRNLWSIFPAYQREDKPAIPMALVQAEIILPSGKELRITSDESWKTHASPNTLLGYWEAHHFEGECYDAALEKDNWNAIDFDDSDWEQVKCITLHSKFPQTVRNLIV